MKLYHGTSVQAAKKALENGLQPRADSQVDSHWETHPSSPDHVYLTVAYAPYFGLNAAGDDDSFAVLEIDTELIDEWSLVPDEDWLEQVSHHQELPEDWDIPEDDDVVGRTKWFRERLHLFQHLWESSLEGLGNCAYEGIIPPHAITRAVFVDSRKCIEMCGMAIDPTISLLNYRFCQAKYKTLTRWFIGEEVSVKDMSWYGLPIYPEHETQLKELLQNTEGLTVSDFRGV